MSDPTPTPVTAAPQTASWFTKAQKLEAKAAIVAANFTSKWGIFRRVIAAHPMLGFWTGIVLGFITGWIIGKVF